MVGAHPIAALRQQVWRQGYRPMAVYSWDFQEPAPAPGKKSGPSRAGKAPYGLQWQLGARLDPPEVINLGTVVAWAENTGVLCDGLRAIDLDIDDAALVEQAVRLAFDMLSVTIVRTRDNSPRCLLVYRAAEGEPAKLTLVGADGKIEVLGRGQQFVAYGRHPSGADLEWRSGGPAELALADIPAVTEEQINRFLNACAPVIGAVPIELKKPKANGHDHTAPATAALIDIAAALALVPNHGALDWETWNNVGLAIYAATGGVQAGWELWRDWSAKHPDNDPDATLARWEHYAKSPPDRTGAGKLFAMAAAASPGWRQPSMLRARERPPQAPPRPVVEEEPGGGGPPEPPDGPDDEWLEEPPGRPEGPEPVDLGDGLITEQYAMRVFVAGNREDLRFNHSSSLWLTWAEHFWRPDERKLAFSWALNLCRDLAATITGRGAAANKRTVERVRFAGSVETGARAMPPFATAQGDWDANPWLLGTPGGIVDLKTGELRAGDRGDMVTKVTTVAPGLIPDCPTWLGFLDYAMNGDDQLVRFIQRYFGYSLTGVTNEEVFLFMFGPGGAGKGTMVETIANIMGDYASTVPMEVFTGKSWSPTEYYRANMAGLRAVMANEPERNAYFSEAFIKEITGGDSISGRHPMGRPFRFKPTHKLVMEGNHMPRLKGRSTGMERRLRILPVTRKPVTPDLQLKQKLLAEAPGILRWLIEGCLMWQRRGLAAPDAVMLASAKYFETQDVFARWIEDRCILDRYAEHSPTELRNSFNSWAKANGEDEMNGNAFSEALDQFESDPPIQRGKQKSKRWVKGIRIMPTDTTQNWNGP